MGTQHKVEDNCYLKPFIGTNFCYIAKKKKHNTTDYSKNINLTLITTISAMLHFASSSRIAYTQIWINT